MPDRRWASCRVCKRHRDEVGPLSWTGLCPDCSHERFEQNIDQLRSHTGPFALHHRRQCVAAWGGVLLDDVTGKP